MGRKKIWLGLVAVTENGNTQYGVTDRYSGIDVVALDLYENRYDADENLCAYFNRLRRTLQVHENNSCIPPLDFRIFINIDADADKICIDKKEPYEVEHSEYPLSQLLKQTEEILQSEPVTSYTSLKLFKLQPVLEEMQTFPEQTEAEEEPAQNHC